MISSRYRFYVLISEETTREQAAWYLSVSPEHCGVHMRKLIVTGDIDDRFHII